MLESKTILGVIPARGGSKGLPGKNLFELEGKTLLEWTFSHAKGSQYLDRVVLSSEDQAIQSAARQIGLEAPFSRPTRLAMDDSSSIDVIRHALVSLDTHYDFVVLLQVTSPLRTSIDIDRCVELCIENSAPACISVVKSEMPPELLFTITDNHLLHKSRYRSPLKARRQERDQYFFPNGAVYVANSRWIMQEPHFISDQTLAYVMPKTRSFDLDEIEDWELIRKLAKEPIQN
jgi:CMP-N,N'-diacetyllegionaminic acid synthase